MIDHTIAARLAKLIGARKMNDIDMQRLLDHLGDETERLRKLGICTHGHLQGPPGKPVLTCLYCGTEFGSHQEVNESRRHLLNE